MNLAMESKDFILPIGMAIVFAGYRYGAHYKANPSSAFSKALLDGLKGAVGMTVLMVLLKNFGIV